MVIDAFTYNGEREMLDLHLNILNPHVDKFIIVEAKTTFSGNKKPLYFMQHEHLFQKFWKKIDYHIINESYSEAERQLAERSPNTQGASHWKNEFLQKESIHKALKQNKVEDDDLVFIGDVDEVWDIPDSLIQNLEYPLYPTKLKLRVYAYYLNNRSSEEFWGTLVARYRDIKGKVLNHLRSDTSIRAENGYNGWHFTSMGGVKEVQRKLNDSYTPESYNTYQVQELLPKRVENGIDYLGRPFEFKIDARDWPPYLQQNIIEYAHLCKGHTSPK